MTKELKDKAISIKGKAYVQVSARVIYFNEEYKNGCIQTKLVSEPKDERVVIKAKAIPDVKNPDRYFTGYSQEVIGDGYINKTSALENAETSAIGRALASMGIGVIDSIASADEMTKAGNQLPTVQLDPNEPNPKCSICSQLMKKSKAGKWYCRHMDKESGQAVWGDPIFPEAKKTPKEEKFIDDLNKEI